MQTHLSELTPSLGTPKLTHKLHTARAEQSRIVFPDVSDGFLHQLFNVLHAHSFPRGARLKRKPADEPSVPPGGQREGLRRAGHGGDGRTSKEKLESRAPEEGGQILCPWCQGGVVPLVLATGEDTQTRPTGIPSNPLFPKK